MENNEDKSIVKSENLAGRVASVRDQINAISLLMKDAMKENEHYGTIPGTNKPTLLKSGAEKLCTLFQIAPEYKIDIKYIGDVHREYIITCKLVSRVSGQFFGEGVGSCSTMEKKFRYRNEYENTGKPVPKSYWDNRDPETIGGKGFFAKKNDNGAWMIFKGSGQMENPDIADTYNTVLKMGKKRALVDAVLTATGASDIFTQDMEDFREEPKDITPPKEPEILMSDSQIEEIRKTMELAKITEQRICDEFPGKKSLSEIPAKAYENIMNRLNLTIYNRQQNSKTEQQEFEDSINDGELNKDGGQ